MWSPAHICVFILLFTLQGTVHRLSSEGGQSVPCIHKVTPSTGFSHRTTQTQAETPCHGNLSEAKWALLLKKDNTLNLAEEQSGIICCVSFSPVSFLCLDYTWVLSSVLDWADLAQQILMCATKYVVQSPTGSDPVFSSCECVRYRLGAAHVYPVPCAAVSLCCHVSCLPTSRLSCSHTGTCGFKCDPDLNRGQAVKGGGNRRRDSKRRDLEPVFLPNAAK